MTDAGLRLLHLSDIHFLGSTDTAIARNTDLRKEIERDLNNLANELGPVDAILIGGDLAYNGFSSQYEEVEKWLHRICDMTRCKKSAIFSVPGNHDVELDQLHESHNRTHEQLRECPEREITTRLERAWAPGDPHRNLLFDSISAYNEFAFPYGCRVDADKPCWQQSLSLSPRLQLRITGLTSTLISSSRDKQGERPLVVGVCQAAKMVRDPETVDLVMCHHPPDWLRDAQQVEPFLARAAVQIFGHKHVFATEFDGRTVRVSAGAVHPNDREPNWEPRYNLIELRELSVAASGTGCLLEIEIYPRVWHDQDTRFVGPDGTPAPLSEAHPVPLDQDDNSSPAAPPAGVPVEPHTPDEMAAEAGGNDPLSPHEEAADAGGDDQPPVDEARDQIDMRDLVYRFLNLPFSVRVAIAVDLNLLDPAEIGDYSEHAVFEQIFLRAQENGRLAEMHDKVRERGETK